MSIEKDGLEAAALTQFSIALNAEIGGDVFAFQGLRKPPEPDSVCMLHGERIHVEVAHIYGTSSDARQALGRKADAAPSREEWLLSSLIPLNDRFIGPLNTVLSKKAEKKYQASRVWLLVRSASILWEVSDFRDNRQKIDVPKTHPFEQIWLLCGPDASFGILRLA